ncbi:MAG: AAA family ATPase [Chloroflexota bacterium]
MPKFLPTSTATFRKIINNDLLYIDKTEYIYHLVVRGTGAYFISRPRRFGKSLLLSTLEELFQGNRVLFRGLWIDESDYGWAPYPVIRIDFHSHPINSVADLDRSIQFQLHPIAERYGITLQDNPAPFIFDELIRKLSAQSPANNQVVILIDEYDKPIIDHLEDPDRAIEIRDALKSFYGVLKAKEAHIRISFITGISKFSKVSIFSELNNLTDLTIDGRFAAMLGITQTELEENFADRLPGFAAKEGLTVEELLDKIRHWYNGFRFTRVDTPVYNPFSTMLLFEMESFHNFWFESGTPSILIKLIHERNYPVTDFDHSKVGELAFSTYDIRSLSLIPILFQTGYLTIKDFNPRRELYTLHYPNYEVQNAFLIYVLDAFSYLDQGLSKTHLLRLIDALEEHDLDTFFMVLDVFFAHIDYDLQLLNEKYYQTIFHVLFTLIGLVVDAEEKTNQGRIDAVIEVDDHIYIFEFKLDDSAEAALAQIKEKEYFKKYWLKEKPITLIGANFNSGKRTIDDWVSEMA